MVEMKSRISGIVSSRPAAIGLRMTVWATEMVAPPIRIMVKWRWTSSSLRPVAYGPGNPAQCPGQLRLVRSRENLTHCAAANFAWRTQCGGAVSAWRGGQAATPGGRVMTIRARRTHGARSNNSGTPEVTNVAEWPRKRPKMARMRHLHHRCVGCANQAPKGVQIVLPGRSNRRAMKAVVQTAFSPSGA